jgi:hypothetical protein
VANLAECHGLRRAARRTGLAPAGHEPDRAALADGGPEGMIRPNYAGVEVTAAGWLRGVYLTFLPSGYG